MLFGLRANALNYVGFCYVGGAPVHGAAALRLRPLCSPLLLAEPPAPRGAPPPPAKDLPPVRSGHSCWLMHSWYSCKRYSVLYNPGRYRRLSNYSGHRSHCKKKPITSESF